VILQASESLNSRAGTTQLLLSPHFWILVFATESRPAAVLIMRPNGAADRLHPTFVDIGPAADTSDVCLLTSITARLVTTPARTRDPNCGNKAADSSHHPLLKRNECLWAGAFLDPQYDDLSADEIYAQLEQSAHSEGSSDRSPTEQQSPVPPDAARRWGSSPLLSGNEVGAGPTPNVTRRREFTWIRRICYMLG